MNFSAATLALAWLRLPTGKNPLLGLTLADLAVKKPDTKRRRRPSEPVDDVLHLIANDLVLVDQATVRRLSRISALR